MGTASLQLSTISWSQVYIHQIYFKIILLILSAHLLCTHTNVKPSGCIREILQTTWLCLLQAVQGTKVNLHPRRASLCWPGAAPTSLTQGCSSHKEVCQWAMSLYIYMTGYSVSSRTEDSTGLTECLCVVWLTDTPPCHATASQPVRGRNLVGWEEQTHGACSPLYTEQTSGHLHVHYEWNVWWWYSVNLSDKIRSYQLSLSFFLLTGDCLFCLGFCVLPAAGCLQQRRERQGRVCCPLTGTWADQASQSSCKVSESSGGWLLPYIHLHNFTVLVKVFKCVAVRAFCHLNTIR